MPSQSNKSFWGRVVEALQDMGVDQSQQTYVANLIKIAQPSVQAWTTGSLPSMKNARKLALALGVRMEWLLTGRGGKRPVPADPQAEALWGIWCRMRPALREQLLDFARFQTSQVPPLGNNGDPFSKNHGTGS